ncbi:MAG: hypothetical protein S4CHLAM6_04250 [Chlamydiae bacterium]|nr:hypothetical protein [Chlamydiota bacterium]
MKKKYKWFLLLSSFIFPTFIFSIPFNLHSPIWESDQLHDPWGFRTKMGDRGVFVLPSYIQDLDWPTVGGFKTTNYPLYLFLFALELGIDFEKLLGAKGTSLYSDFVVHNGASPTQNYVKDFQGFDNLEAFSLVQLAELWIQQDFLEGKLDLRVGKIDTYGVFIYTPFAQDLINNSFSQFPTILAYPSYPSPAVGIIVNAKPAKWITLRTSIFDGSTAQNIRTGNLGAKRFFQNLGKHVLLLNEVNFFWGREHYFGEAILGFWGFNGRLVNFNGGSSGKATGPYASLSQTLWKQRKLHIDSTQEFKPSALGAFSQWGYVNQKISGAKFFLAGGLKYKNIVKKFDRDSLSIGATTVYFSQSPGSSFTQSFETALECTYQIKLIKGVLIQPDLQWIINPGGEGRRNALVALLRLTVSI